MSNAPSTLLIGQAGVWRVAAKLALLGVNPLFPGVDHGYDLATDSGHRIQVKAASFAKRKPYPAGAYFFKFWQGPWVSAGGVVRVRGQRDYSTCCDLVVFWGITEDRFWIVPASLIATLHCVALGPKGFYQRESFEDAHTLREQGLSQTEIGERLGISQSAVSYQLRGGRKARPKPTMTSVVREHEDRWDLITGTSTGVESTA